MTINIKQIENSRKTKKTLTVQANDCDKLLDMISFFEQSPKSIKEIAKKYKFSTRQAGYYSNALGTMGLVEIIKYNRHTLYGLTKEGVKFQKGSSPSKFALFLRKINFVDVERKRIFAKEKSDEVKKRRLQAIDSIERWIEGKLNETI